MSVTFLTRDVIGHKNYGLVFTGGGTGDNIRIAPATNEQIDAASNVVYNPIVPSNLEYAVKKYAPTFTVTPEMFGAVGDGVTDDTSAIQAMIEYGKTNGITNFTFESGKTYLVSMPEIEVSDDWAVNTQRAQAVKKIFNIDFDNAVFNLNNSTVKLAPHMYPYYSIFYVNGDNCTISNGIIEGEKNEHDYTTFIYRAEGVAATHEFGYGIEQVGCTGLIVDNVEIFNTTGDAVITGDASGACTTTIKNCNLHHCRRQGLSCLGGDKVYVYDTKIHHIGTSDGIDGTSPMAGIDIEPDSGTFLLNYCQLRNVDIEQCTAAAFIIGGNVTKVDVHGCNFDGIVNVTDALNFYDCNFLFDANSLKETITYYLLGNYARCKFEFLDKSRFTDGYIPLRGMYRDCEFYGEVDDENHSIAFITEGTCNIRQCRFYNVLGNAVYAGIRTNAITDNIQPIDDCYFYNSILLLKQWSSDFILQNCVFEDAAVQATTVDLNYKLYNCIFKNSYTWAVAGSTVIMDNCHLTYLSGNDIFANAHKIIRNSFVEVNSLATTCFLNGGLICNSTIKLHAAFLAHYFGGYANCYNVQLITSHNTQAELDAHDSLVNTYVVTE